MIEVLAEPLGEAFMRRALLEITLVGITSGLLGCWVILFGVSYAAESMAHALLPGLVLAALAAAPLLAGAVPGIALAGIAIFLLSRAPGIDRDTAVAVAVTGLLGLGSLLALSASTPPGLADLLFGDVLGTSGADLALAMALAIAIMVALRLLHGSLLATGFDPATAREQGARPALAEFGLLFLLAGTILVAVQALGNLLVVAVLVGPAATARLLCNRVGPMMAVSSGLAVGLGIAGLYVSYYAGTAAGASIALAMVLAYAVAALLPLGRPLRSG